MSICQKIWQFMHLFGLVLLPGLQNVAIFGRMSMLISGRKANHQPVAWENFSIICIYWILLCLQYYTLCTTISFERNFEMIEVELSEVTQIFRNFTHTRAKTRLRVYRLKKSVNFEITTLFPTPLAEWNSAAISNLMYFFLALALFSDNTILFEIMPIKRSLGCLFNFFHCFDIKES